jgi:hypothetical protein
MSMETNERQSLLTLHSDRIKLADGRYLIYYTFTNTTPQEDHSREKEDVKEDRPTQN